MEIAVECSRMTNSEELVTVWDSRRLNAFRRQPMAVYLYQAIDDMGKGSRLAQGLNTVLTSVQRLVENPTHRLYLLCEGRLCLGILKVGPKKLFIRGKTGQLNEIDPLCVLDFYVHESQQRNGHGRMLFDYMLAAEDVQPHRLGYDRPSPKFLGFLRKHFSLSDYVPQSNNFVVFTQYFDGFTDRLAKAKAATLGREIFTASPTTLMKSNSAIIERSTPEPRAPLTSHVPPRSSMLNSAPTMGLSSSCYAGRPAGSQDLRTSTARPANAGHRERSPTRSGVSYDIISLQGAEVAAASTRPAGRRSVRQW